MDKIFVEIREVPYLRFTPSSIGIFFENDYTPLVDKIIKILGKNGYYKCNLLIESKDWFENQKEYEN